VTLRVPLREFEMFAENIKKATEVNSYEEFCRKMKGLTQQWQTDGCTRLTRELYVYVNCQY
jgi:hypothetical protein